MSPERLRTIILALLVLALLACKMLPVADVPVVEPSRTPFQPLDSSQVQPESDGSIISGAQNIEAKTWTLRISESVPAALREQVNLPEGFEIERNGSPTNLVLDAMASSGEGPESQWVYALVGPFPTILDEVSGEDLKRAWEGETLEFLNGRPLLMASSTEQALTRHWGPPAAEAVRAVKSDNLLEKAWEKPYSLAVVPFERLEPRWKVIRIEGTSPLDKDFSFKKYPLRVRFGLTGEPEALALLANNTESFIPENNRDTQKMSVVVMTGVTALVRATGAKMESNGISYPGEDIRHWLTEADLTHISNEVSFDESCPPANPYQYSLQFCSRLEYLDLLDYVGMDIMELTGNHLMDWGRNAFDNSLELYEERSWKTYAAGADLAAARQPLLIEHNGNKLAFLGCNPAGPEYVWATDNRSGVTDCADDWILEEITHLRGEGYLPIVTLQYFESYGFVPSTSQQRYFQSMAEAGAVIVSGSQAHHPQTMAFYEDQFIHYGLGNLFFDQMRLPDGYGVPVFDVEDLPVPGTRLEFIDRHIFYDGRYLGTEILTAMLEDYSRPRPMTVDERKILLRNTFESSGW